MPSTLRRSCRRSALVALGAGLLFASAAIHLDLYLTGYRDIPTIGQLFLLQAAAAMTLAIATVAVDRLSEQRRGISVAVWLTAAVFALGTIGAYGLSRAVGLFGFHEQPTTAGLVAGVLEVGVFAAMALLVTGAVAGRLVPPASGVVTAALLAVVLASGIGGPFASSATTSPTQARAAGRGPAATRVVRVVISDYAYHPAFVKVRPGETIAVTNEDKVTHTMTAVPGSMPFGGFNTGYVDPGKTVDIRAPRIPGTYDFYCSIHNFMKGVLVVTK